MRSGSGYGRLLPRMICYLANVSISPFGRTSSGRALQPFFMSLSLQVSSLHFVISPSFLIFVFRCQHRPYKNSHAPPYFITGTRTGVAGGISLDFHPSPHCSPCAPLWFFHAWVGRFVQYVTRSVAPRRDEKSPSLWTEPSRRRSLHMWFWKRPRESFASGKSRPQTERESPKCPIFERKSRLLFASCLFPPKSLVLPLPPRRRCVPFISQ